MNIRKTGWIVGILGIIGVVSLLLFTNIPPGGHLLSSSLDANLEDMPVVVDDKPLSELTEVELTTNIADLVAKLEGLNTNKTKKERLIADNELLLKNAQNSIPTLELALMTAKRNILPSEAQVEKNIRDLNIKIQLIDDDIVLKQTRKTMCENLIPQLQTIQSEKNGIITDARKERPTSIPSITAALVQLEKEKKIWNAKRTLVEAFISLEEKSAQTQTAVIKAAIVKLKATITSTMASLVSLSVKKEDIAAIEAKKGEDLRTLRTEIATGIEANAQAITAKKGELATSNARVTELTTTLTNITNCKTGTATGKESITLLTKLITVTLPAQKNPLITQRDKEKAKLVPRDNAQKALDDARGTIKDTPAIIETDKSYLKKIVEIDIPRVEKLLKETRDILLDKYQKQYDVLALQKEQIESEGQITSLSGQIASMTEELNALDRSPIYEYRTTGYDENGTEIVEYIEVWPNEARATELHEAINNAGTTLGTLQGLIESLSVSITTISTAASKSGIKIDTTRPITGGITSGGTGGELIDEGNFLQAGGEDNISSSAGTAAPITNQTTPAKPISWPLTIDQVMSQYSVSEEVVRKEILEVMKLQESRSAFYVGPYCGRTVPHNRPDITRGDLPGVEITANFSGMYGGKVTTECLPCDNGSWHQGLCRMCPGGLPYTKWGCVDPLATPTKPEEEIPSTECVDKSPVDNKGDKTGELCCPDQNGDNKNDNDPKLLCSTSCNIKNDERLSKASKSCHVCFYETGDEYIDFKSECDRYLLRGSSDIKKSVSNNSYDWSNIETVCGDKNVKEIIVEINAHSCPALSSAIHNVAMDIIGNYYSQGLKSLSITHHGCATYNNPIGFPKKNADTLLSSLKDEKLSINVSLTANQITSFGLNTAEIPDAEDASSYYTFEINSQCGEENNKDDGHVEGVVNDIPAPCHPAGSFCVFDTDLGVNTILCTRDGKTVSMICGQRNNIPIYEDESMYKGIWKNMILLPINN